MFAKHFPWIGWKTMLLTLVLVVLSALLVVTIWVEAEPPYAHETLGGGGDLRALVLYHPSRDARFSDELSLAFADGLKFEGFSVERATMTRDTPAELKAYALIAVVSNTFYWTPDFPTLRYLRRAHLDGIYCVGLIAGAGSTERAQRMLDEAMRNARATVLETRPYWVSRPNDPARKDESNREAAMRLAKQFGVESGKRVHSAMGAHPRDTQLGAQ